MRFSQVQSLLMAILLTASVWMSVGIQSWTLTKERGEPDTEVADHDVLVAAGLVNAYFESQWRDFGISVANKADDLTVLRRLSLALHGSIPSLEDIREFEGDLRPGRIERWTNRLLDDPRFGAYFAGRFSRILAGVENQTLIIYRQDRFEQWLAEQINDDRPIQEWVCELITQTGLWTGKPATNFVTATVQENDVDENQLIGRTVRTFLGQRIDCAQCHDHPFDDWTQKDYQGLAAFYGNTRFSIFGIYDGRGEIRLTDPSTNDEKAVIPSVPFCQELLPEDGTQRERLAAWITHRENRRFTRAIANRVWGLMFGLAWSQGGPLHHEVDDLPDPPDTDDLLDILGDVLLHEQGSVKSVIRVIVASRPFNLSSETIETDSKLISLQQDYWGLFPLVALRPEQVIGAMVQSTSLSTIDQNSHLLTRTIRVLRENDFLKEYGAARENEFSPTLQTIPQTLLKMNSRLVRELLETNPFNASAKIARMSTTDQSAVENVFLVCLTRRPTEEEMEHFLARGEGDDRSRRLTGHEVEDLIWTCFNSEEFNWNH